VDKVSATQRGRSGGSGSNGENGSAVELLLRELTPQVIAVVARRYHDFDAAEDAVQEALLAAARQWGDGVPENPRAWLIRVAHRRMIDSVRSDAARRIRELAVGAEAVYAQALDERELQPEADDTLTLLFMCCHPALTPTSAIALTLRAVGGLSTFQIAHAFLVPEHTMAQRITRAKESIRKAGARFEMPVASERPERVSEVLRVLYLVFNEGYTTSAGVALLRDDLAREAIRLTRMLAASIPDEPEAAGLLARMLLTDARCKARTGPAGELIPLDRQERGLWNQDQITEGIALISATIAKGRVGPYQIQAAISAVHDEATSYERTDWPQILGLYELLLKVQDDAVVRLNHAVAAAMVHGAPHGLRLLDDLVSDHRLERTHRLEAVRAHLLERTGDRAGAVRSYRAAARKTDNLSERDYLLLQAARLAEEPAQKKESRHEGKTAGDD
jgi:RNA polymerase sigma factor (sigma-70 family)